MRGTESRSNQPEAPAGWKTLLALVSLALSVLLWLGGLIGSLERPSVVDSLSLRQLELAALASEVVPGPLRPALVGEDPRAALSEELRRQMERVDDPPTALRRLELALLERPASVSEDPAADADLRRLLTQVEASRRPLIQALIDDRPTDGKVRSALLAPWSAPRMVEQLVCEQLDGAPETCPSAVRPLALVVKLLGVTTLPLLFLLVGILLLLRAGWQAWRHRLPAAPALLGPPLTPVDVTLLIAGGFVLVGEVLAPALAQPPLRSALTRLRISAALSQGIEVLVLYLALMAVPLVILLLMLPRRSTVPAGGWLQWHWRPVGTAVRGALGTLLMVLPLVTLSSWLVEQIWTDPGGSNPLLELVLTSDDPPALACFAVTALVAAPLFEETLFRGVLLPVAAQRVGAASAVVMSAAVFAVAHLSLGELAPLFILGLGLGWLRWRSGRLASSVVMHSLWNGLTFMNLLFLAQ